jgi:Calcineurin-like phosphoesterase
MRTLLCLVFAVAACTSPSNANNGDDDTGGSNNGSNGSGGGGGGGSGGDGSGSNGGSGTTSSDLVFAVVGDTRPSSVDDTTNYPTSIITKIFQDIAATSAQFVIGTGDYQYASTTGSEQAPQIAKYMTARAGYSGPFYPAMGNHECTGYTDSECGSGNSDGVTKNFTAFQSAMLGPINQTNPYYVENVAATDGSWTAKFVFIACNYWSSTQASWLSTQLAVSTTYTFVIRHESVADMSTTGCSASQTTVNKYPLTLLIVGHTHEYSHESSDKEIINGIGGAPLTSGTNYGYTMITRNSDGTLTVTTYDYSSGSTIDTFKIKADGTAD